jgi:REP element-mobilizing transposase RayT
MALAYFLTWTCHGSWLPGDARGSVDRAHREYGTAYAPASAERERANRIGDRVQMLEAEERAVVERAVLDHCAIKGWRLLALNVRSSHVHVVVSNVPVSPEAAMGQFKSWATRRLREAGLRGEERVWTREGSTRHLFTEESVARAVRYVLEGQGEELRKGEA